MGIALLPISTGKACLKRLGKAEPNLLDNLSHFAIITLNSLLSSSPSSAEERLGPERAALSYPIKSLLVRGGPLVFGSIGIWRI